MIQWFTDIVFFIFIYLFIYFCRGEVAFVISL